MLTKIHPSLLCFFFLLVACTTPAQQPNLAVAPTIGQLVMAGPPATRDMGTTTETVWNCGQGGGTIVKHPSMSVTTNYAVEWQVGGTAGVGTTVGKGVIPAGVDLTATLEGHYKKGFDQGITQGTGWDLPAEQNTSMVYTLMWRETWQPAYVDVTFVDTSVIKINLRYRSGIQSDVVGKRVQLCDQQTGVDSPNSTLSATPKPTDSPISRPPTSRPPTSVPTRPNLPMYSMDERDFMDKSLDEFVSQGNLLCLTTGPISISTSKPPIQFPGNDHGSAICWIGPQRAQASGLAGSSIKRVTIQSGSAEEISISLVHKWESEMKINGCGWKPCIVMDLAVIRSDGSVIRP